MGTSLKEEPASQSNVSKAKGSTQSQVTQKQKNTHFIMINNQLADKKFNPVSDRSYANKKVKTKGGTGNNAQGSAN